MSNRENVFWWVCTLSLLSMLFMYGCVEVGSTTNGVDTSVDVCTGTECGDGNTNTEATE